MIYGNKLYKYVIFFGYKNISIFVGVNVDVLVGMPFVLFVEVFV